MAHVALEALPLAIIEQMRVKVTADERPSSLIDIASESHQTTRGKCPRSSSAAFERVDLREWG